MALVWPLITTVHWRILQYDWPRSQIDSVRSVVAVADILDRVQAVIGDRMGVPTSPTTQSHPSKSRACAVEVDAEYGAAEV